MNLKINLPIPRLPCEPAAQWATCHWGAVAIRLVSHTSYCSLGTSHPLPFPIAILTPGPLRRYGIIVYALYSRMNELHTSWTLMECAWVIVLVLMCVNYIAYMHVKIHDGTSHFPRRLGSSRGRRDVLWYIHAFWTSDQFLFVTWALHEVLSLEVDSLSNMCTDLSV